MRQLEKKVYLTSEHVSPSHPDKVCDVLVENLLYAVQSNNIKARFACDGSVKNNIVSLVGEISDRLESSKENRIILNTLEELGYGTKYCEEFNLKAFGKRYGWYINKAFTTQSENIARGVDSEGENRASAGDIGIMYGYATNETKNHTFAPHYVAKRILKELYSRWKSGTCGELRPDMKCLVTMAYVHGVPVSIEKVVVCISHAKGAIDSVRSLVTNLTLSTLNLISYEYGWSYPDTISVNPTGDFYIYGPYADSGLVGRKIVCDQYGGAAPVGGGNLNGKDVTKVDRSGVYMARYIANRIVSEGLANKAMVQLAYEIGRPNAVSINVSTDGTPFWKNRKLRKFVSTFDTSVQGIIDTFHLYGMSKDVHKECAMWGHIGSELFPWER